MNLTYCNKTPYIFDLNGDAAIELVQIEIPSSITICTGCPDQIGRNLKTTLLQNQKTYRKYKDSFGIVKNRAIIYVFC